MILVDNLKFGRADWMSILAKAPFPILENLWLGFKGYYPCQILRKPVTGLVMVRGRMGGYGAPFNAGEATVTRCSVKSERGNIGHAYILGRNHQHAKIAAEIDAALQDNALQSKLIEKIILPLKEAAVKQSKQHQAKTAATKVDFFTVVRGED